MPFFYIDRYYILLVLPAALLSLWAQSKVNSTYAKYRNMRTNCGYSGQQIARFLLDSYGLRDVNVVTVAGNLTDHYDPSRRVVRLSQDVFYGTSVAALGVAAHETGHAIQHAEGYVPLKIRTAIIPVTNFGSQLSMPMLFLGLILGIEPLVTFGILLFSLMTVFQFVTLPVEFNASTRAVDALSAGLLTSEELGGTKKVLTAAALTYVAALIVSAMQLLRLVLLFGNRRRD
ncbi:MAG: zinc metallopeptidase [Oscillospiraceae bacterium]|nr:zinc metallopeptidase [Oscillospiraceae bacterium]